MIKVLRKNWRLYTFLILPLLYLLLFKYQPMLGIQIAFRKFNAVDGIWGSPWVGLEYFNKFFSSYQFPRVLGNTLRLSIYSLAAGFPIPVILALLINAMRSAKLKKFVQTVTYIPHFISTVVLVGMILQIANTRIGLYGIAWRSVFGTEAPDILGSPKAFPHLYVWSGIWQNAGWNTIVYIAALASVDPGLCEAAEIDGASRFQRLVHIDFPSLVPLATIMLIMNAGHIMSIGFEKVYLMQNSLNRRSSEVISTYVYQVGLGTGRTDFSYATAIGLFNSVINLTLLIIVNTISRKVGANSLW